MHSGLLAARLVVGADVTVVAQGPGNLGTGTRWGFSGVTAGEAVNAAGVLGGRPVAVAARVRGRSARASPGPVAPQPHGARPRRARAGGRRGARSADHFWTSVRSQAAELCAQGGLHRLVEVPTDGLREALEASPVPLSTMGRGPDDDEPAFLAAAAAGRHAATLL